MSTREFIEEILAENQEKLDKLRKLREILDRLTEREQRFYTVSVTSNL